MNSISVYPEGSRKITSVDLDATLIEDIKNLVRSELQPLDYKLVTTIAELERERFDTLSTFVKNTEHINELEIKVNVAISNVKAFKKLIKGLGATILLLVGAIGGLLIKFL